VGKPIDELYDSVLSGRESIGRVVKRIRRVTGMTQREFALARGVSFQTLRLIERDAANPTVDTLEKLCEGFDLKVGFFYSPQ
jgi:transcriptional regulator with XRE-family HTH domain